MINKIVKQASLSKEQYNNLYFEICRQLQKEALDEIDFTFFVVYGLKFKVEEIKNKDNVIIIVTLTYTSKESSRGDTTNE